MMLNREKLKPLHVVDTFYRLQAEDIKNMKFLSKEMINLNCFVCNGVKHNTFGVKSGFKIKKCSNCSMVFVNERPSNQKLIEYYSNSKASVYFQKNIIEPSIKYRTKKIILPRLNFVNSFKIPVGSWLDIGCSTGILLSEVAKLGWQTYGIEFEEYAVKQCKKNGIYIYNDSIDKLNLFKKFDIITMFELLEHTFNPKETLESCFKATKNGGFLIMTMPNIEGIEFKIAGLAHSNICPPNHLNYFSPITIKKLLKSIGYEIVVIDTPGLLDIDNIKIFMGNNKSLSTGNKMLDEIITQDDEHSISLRHNLQKYIINKKLSGNLRVVARKN